MFDFVFGRKSPYYSRVAGTGTHNKNLSQTDKNNAHFISYFINIAKHPQLATQWPHKRIANCNVIGKINKSFSKILKYSLVFAHKALLPSTLLNLHLKQNILLNMYFRKKKRHTHILFLVLCFHTRISQKNTLRCAGKIIKQLLISFNSFH